MKLRKVAVKKFDALKYHNSGEYTDEIEYYGYFHKWFNEEDSGVFAIIETEEGIIRYENSCALIFTNEVKKI